MGRKAVGSTLGPCRTRAPCPHAGPHDRGPPDRPGRRARRSQTTSESPLPESVQLKVGRGLSAIGEPSIVSPPTTRRPDPHRPQRTQPIRRPRWSGSHAVNTTLRNRPRRVLGPGCSRSCCTGPGGLHGLTLLAQSVSPPPKAAAKTTTKASTRTTGTTTPHGELVVPRSGKGRKLPAEVLTADEVKALVRACSTRAPTGVRNRTLLVALSPGDLPVRLGDPSLAVTDRYLRHIGPPGAYRRPATAGMGTVGRPRTSGSHSGWA